MKTINTIMYQGEEYLLSFSGVALLYFENNIQQGHLWFNGLLIKHWRKPTPLEEFFITTVCRPSKEGMNTPKAVVLTETVRMKDDRTRKRFVIL